jgi:N-acetylmuramoyl-L-alanine amidase
VFRLFLLLFFTLFSYSDTFTKELKYHFSNITGDNTKSVRSFNNIKMLYLDAILSENQKNQFLALDDLLKASNVINLKVPSSYKAEFKKLSKKYKKGYNAPIGRKKSKINKPTYSKINNLKSIKKQYNGVFLIFNKFINKKNISYNVWKSKRYYHHIYDIKNAKSNTNTQSIQFKIGKVKIGQYKKNIIRVSLKSKYKRLSKFYIYQNKLNISFRENLIKKKKKKKTKKKRNINKIPQYEIKSSSTIKYNQTNFKNKSIIIDPGHGGKDSGTLGKGGIKEKDIVLKISKYLKNYLQNKGFKVYLTRHNDSFVDLKKRTKLANVRKADLFISIHANASKKRQINGIETYFLSTSKSKKAKMVALRENSLGVKSLGRLSKNLLLNVVNRQKIVASNKLAIDIQRNMLAHISKKGYKIKDHGVRGGPFWVLVGARMPNVLVEVGYLSNKKEAKKLTKKSYQKIVAKGIAMGIESYLEKN